MKNYVFFAITIAFTMMTSSPSEAQEKTVPEPLPIPYIDIVPGDVYSDHSTDTSRGGIRVQQGNRGGRNIVTDPRIHLINIDRHLGESKANNVWGVVRYNMDNLVGIKKVPYYFNNKIFPHVRDMNNNYIPLTVFNFLDITNDPKKQRPSYWLPSPGYFADVCNGAAVDPFFGTNKTEYNTTFLEKEHTASTDLVTKMRPIVHRSGISTYQDRFAWQSDAYIIYRTEINEDGNTQNYRHLFLAYPNLAQNGIRTLEICSAPIGFGPTYIGNQSISQIFVGLKKQFQKSLSSLAKKRGYKYRLPFYNKNLVYVERSNGTDAEICEDLQVSCSSINEAKKLSLKAILSEQAYKELQQKVSEKLSQDEAVFRFIGQNNVTNSQHIAIEPYRILGASNTNHARDYVKVKNIDSFTLPTENMQELVSMDIEDFLDRFMTSTPLISSDFWGFGYNPYQRNHWNMANQ